METSLHRQLKQLYADPGARVEAPLDNYRIDVICDGELIEIQHGSLAAIRRKVQDLLLDHRVLVVKPIVRQKRLVKQQTKGGRILGRRMSPKRGSVIDLFDELIYFTRVFPHQNLALDVPLVDVEEWRYPGHGRRRRRRGNDHQVEDQNYSNYTRFIGSARLAISCNSYRLGFQTRFTPGTSRPRWTCHAGRHNGSRIVCATWADSQRWARKATRGSTAGINARGESTPRCRDACSGDVCDLRVSNLVRAIDIVGAKRERNRREDG